MIPEPIIKVAMIVLMSIILFYDFKYLRIPIWYLLGLLGLSVIGREREWNQFLIIDFIPLFILGFSSLIAFLKVRKQPVGTGDFFLIAAFGVYFGLPLSLMIIIVSSASILLYHFFSKKKAEKYPLAAVLNAFGILVLVGLFLKAEFLTDLYFYDFIFTD